MAHSSPSRPPVLYHWSRCSDCRRARERLRAAGYQATERDFFASPLSALELNDIALRAGGAREIFSFRSPSFKALRLDPDHLSDQKLLDLILQEPRMLKRPLLDQGGSVLVGARAITEMAAGDLHI